MKKLGTVQTLGVAGLLAVALATPFALAQSTTPQPNQDGGQQHGRMGRQHGKRGGGGLLRGRLAQRLNLTEAQQTQLKQLVENHRANTQALRAELKAKRQELRHAQQGGTFNEALATQKLTESAATRARLMAEQFKLRQEMLAVLTPEQKAQFEQLQQEFKAKRAQFQQNRQHRRAQRG
jgi:periplasmic protein CpxP/Spy